MVGISWCVKNKDGLRLVESNANLAKGYLKMAEEALGTMSRERDKNVRFSISAGYYSIYYSVYSLMQKIGIKCEIHACSIEFTKKFLGEFYSKKDLELLEKSLIIRKNLQYYVDRFVGESDLNLIWKSAYNFFILSRDILSKLDEKKVNEIRNKFEEILK
jgi:uncharacterized protein (UPF0332 family)